jgi:hypothetical protein
MLDMHHPNRTYTNFDGRIVIPVLLSGLAAEQTDETVHNGG